MAHETRDLQNLGAPGDLKSDDTLELSTFVPEPVTHHRPHTLREFWDYIKQFAKPGYHWRKIKEDFRASIHALRNRDLVVLKNDEASLAHAVRGRLLATYFMVGPFGMLGPIAGAFFQYKLAQHFPWVSVASFFITILIGNIFSIIGFQIIWALSANPLYRHRVFFDILLFWRDLLPLQANGFKRWAGANVILMPLCTVMLSLIDRFAPAFAKAVPVGVLTPMLEIVFVHTSLIRLMGDLFERESRRIAANHAHAS